MRFRGAWTRGLCSLGAGAAAGLWSLESSATVGRCCQTLMAVCALEPARWLRCRVPLLLPGVEGVWGLANLVPVCALLSLRQRARCMWLCAL